MNADPLFATCDTIPPNRGKDEPDYTRMIGYLRAIWLSFRYDLPHLRQTAIDAIAQDAKRAGGES